MASLETQSLVKEWSSSIVKEQSSPIGKERSSCSFLSYSYKTPKQVIRCRIPISTIKAPFEVSSFFYRLWQEADEQKQSPTAFAPDDTLIPDPMSLISSSLATQLSSSYSFGEITDFERISKTWFQNDEGTGRSSLPFPSFPVTVLGSSLRTDKQFSDEKLDVLDLSRQGSLNLKLPKHLRKKRAHSTDFAYSEANEISRIDVGMLKSPQAREKFVLEEKKEEMSLINIAKSEANEMSRIDVGILKSPQAREKFVIEEKKEEIPLVHIAKVHLERGRQGLIFSKPMLKRKEKRYKRRKDDFAATYLMQNRLQKSTRTSHKRAFFAIPSVPMLKELTEEEREMYISLSENLASCNTLGIKHHST